MGKWLKIGLLAAVVLVLVGLALYWHLTPPQLLPAFETHPSSLLFPDVTVVNPGRGHLEHQDVLVAEGAIGGIGPTEGSTASEYQGAFLLPGLIDMHTHLPPRSPLQLTALFCALYLANGVTAVRDTGDTSGDAIPAAWEGIESGAFPGPRIYSCGPFVVGGPPRWANSIQLGDPSNAEAVVRRIQQDGFSCVKSYDDLTLAQIEALKSAAASAGLPVIAHVPTALGYEEALLPEVAHLLGVPPPASLPRDHILDRITHWRAVDDARMEQIVEATLQHGIVNTPTLVAHRGLTLYRDYSQARMTPMAQILPRMYRDVVWHPQDGLPFFRNLTPEQLDTLDDAYQKKRDLVGRLYRAGAQLRIGTDVQQPFVAPGLSMHEEMSIFAEIGIPPERIWEMATREAGRELGTPQLGVLEPGAPADFLIFERDPTRNLADHASLLAVVSRGQLFKREQLDAAVEAYRSHFEDPLVDALSVNVTRVLLQQTIKRDY